MNKRISRVISSTVIVTAMSMTGISSNMILGSTKAYAASYKLTNIDMSGANLYENTNYTKELDSDKSLKDTYYAKLSSDRSKVSIDIDGVDEDCVSITKSGNSKTYEPGDDISILTGKTTLKITVYESPEDKENKKNAKKTYKIIIKRYTKEEEEERRNDDQSDIYLQTLELDYGDIPLGFRFDKMNYNVTVDNDIKTLVIRAVPEDGAYDVAVNGIKLKEDEDYKKNINVASSGTTKVEITLSYDEEEYRTYTINITKKDKNSENHSTQGVTNEASEESNGKIEQVQQNNSLQITENNNEGNVSGNVSNNNSSNNGWIKSGEKWSYKDDYGNVLKNTWFYDRSYDKKYYFDNDGYMVTGWKQVGSSWYYLDNSGAMVTGWCKVGTSWYYLDYDGTMKTGWFKDRDGKYYYLYASGEMAVNTTINGYKLGNDGAWITK